MALCTTGTWCRRRMENQQPTLSLRFHDSWRETIWLRQRQNALRQSRLEPFVAGVFRGQLHDFLKRVLCWVLESMPRVEWVACLGNEAWFLTCMTINNPTAAQKFRQYRDSFEPVVGSVGKKVVVAFPLHDPSRVSNEVAENEWRAFAVRFKSKGSHSESAIARS